MMKAEELKLTQEWDKVFPKSEKVDHKKVTFVNHFGITLAADMYITNYRYRQIGLTITLVTVPVQLMAFAPGCSTGESPLMWSFIRVKPW